MSWSEWIAVAINILLGAYFIRYYPRTLERMFGARPMPRGFVLLRLVVKYAGIIALAGTALYVGLRLTGLYPRSPG